MSAEPCAHRWYPDVESVVPYGEDLPTALVVTAAVKCWDCAEIAPGNVAARAGVYYLTGHKFTTYVSSLMEPTP